MDEKCNNFKIESTCSKSHWLRKVSDERKGQSLKTDVLCPRFYESEMRQAFVEEVKCLKRIKTTSKEGIG